MITCNVNEEELTPAEIEHLIQESFVLAFSKNNPKTTLFISSISFEKKKIGFIVLDSNKEKEHFYSIAPLLPLLNKTITKETEIDIKNIPYIKETKLNLKKLFLSYKTTKRIKKLKKDNIGKLVYGKVIKKKEQKNIITIDNLNNENSDIKYILLKQDSLKKDNYERNIVFSFVIKNIKFNKQTEEYNVFLSRTSKKLPTQLLKEAFPDFFFLTTKRIAGAYCNIKTDLNSFNKTDRQKLKIIRQDLKEYLRFFKCSKRT